MPRVLNRMEQDFKLVLSRCGQKVQSRCREAIQDVSITVTLRASTTNTGMTDQLNQAHTRACLHLSEVTP